MQEQRMAELEQREMRCLGCRRSTHQ
jgi:hypothetical protein